MKCLFVYLKDYKKECILAPLFKMLEATFELLIPLIVARLIDEGIGGEDNGVIIRCFILMVSLALVGLIASLTAQYFAARAAVCFSANVRHAMFEHLLKLDFAGIDEVGTDVMITRMTSDVNQLQNGVNMVLRLLLRSPFVVFGAMIMAFTIDLRSALIFLLIIILLFAVIFFLMKINIKQSGMVQERLEKVLGRTRENLSGVRVLRAFCREKNESHVFEEENKELTDRLKVAGNLSAIMNPLTYVLMNLAILLLLYVDGIQVSRGNLSSGQVVALYNYMSQILVELLKLANLIVLVNKFIASAGRVEAVLKTSPHKTEGKEDTGLKDYEDYIRFDHVSLNYTGSGENSLNDIDFAVNKGETVGIIGGTGSGKSSLVQMLAGFYDAREGSVRIEGRDVRDYTYEALSKKVGIVMQKAVLFKGSIRENMSWANKDASDEEYIAALKAAQAYEVALEKGGLDASVETMGRNFSGGQRQRLSIARTLLGRPDILILDDSSSALDYLTDLNLRKAIRNLDYKPTVFIVSQRSASIMSADKIIVLEDGRIVGLGKHDELLKNCEVYREIYESQYGKEQA